MSDQDNELLHRYLDDQMEPAERLDFEKMIETDETLRTELSALGQIGDMLRTHVDETVEQIEFDAFYADIERKIGADDAHMASGFFETLKQFVFSPLGASAFTLAAVALFFALRNAPLTASSLEQGGGNPPVVVEDGKVEGQQLIQVSKPVKNDQPTAAWLLEGEKDAGLNGDSTVEKPF